MLVLSRRINEKIVIAHQIVVTVVDIVGDKVRIGIDAPDDITIHREEVQRRIEAGEPKPSRRTEPRRDEPGR